MDRENNRRPAVGGRITDLSSQVRDPERINVFLDGSFAFGLDRELALREGLRIGDELDAARVAALRAADDVAKATTNALGLLARRPRSEREVRDRLRQKGYAPEAIDAAIAKLEGWRYLDDADFARYWVENREAHQPRGRRLLEQELRQKGVDREVVRDAIAAAELDEQAAALEIARKKQRSYAGEEPAVVRRRLGSFLARRGYGWDVVRPVLDRLLGEGDDDELGDEG
ncbi:MAG: RecX family transcriptional regulator [Chloroflexota bacterium]|nr:RecX family transcriptional regulator [Chloroflexota bacterium]